MGIFKNIQGTLLNIFKIGGNSGIGLKNNSAVAEVKTAADDAFVVLRAKEIQSSNAINDVPTLLDLKGRIANIQFSFEGATAPAAGANTGKFGFCKTSGGSYTAGDVVYDTGTVLMKIPSAVVNAITVDGAVSGGTISLIDNGLYVNDAGTWTLKGDGSGTATGALKAIEISYDFEDATVSSTTALVDGDRVVRVINLVSQAFNGTAPTLLVQADGTSDLSLMATTESDLKTANQYEVEDIKSITADYAGVVKLTVTPDSSSAGTGKVLVFYVSPLA